MIKLLVIRYDLKKLLWLDGNVALARVNSLIFSVFYMSLHGSLHVFSRIVSVLTRKNGCGFTDNRCPYTEILLAFDGTQFSMISRLWVKKPEIRMTYVCKYKSYFLLTTTRGKEMSLHGNEIFLKFLQKVVQKHWHCGFTEMGAEYAK